MKQSEQIWIILSIALLTAALVGGGVYWWLTQSSAPPESPIARPARPAERRPPVVEREATPTPAVEPKTKTVTDQANLYTIKVSQDWVVTKNEGAKGVQLSNLTVQSPDFKMHTDPTAEGPFEPQYYDEGAQLNIHALPGTDSGEHSSVDTVTETRTVQVGGVEVPSHTFTVVSTYAGQFLDAHVNYQGNHYLITMAYNPDTFPQGKKIFDQILDSFTFK